MKSKQYDNVIMHTLINLPCNKIYSSNHKKTIDEYTKEEFYKELGNTKDRLCCTGERLDHALSIMKVLIKSDLDSSCYYELVDEAEKIIPLQYGPYIGGLHAAINQAGWKLLASERKSHRAGVLLVPLELQRELLPNLEDNLFIGDDEKIPQRLTDWILKDNLDKNLIKGDVVHFPCGGYRNDGSYFWDGKKVIEYLYDENVDEYGSVLKEWTIPEFPVKYFEQVVAHNVYVWIDPKYDKEIKGNITYGLPDVIKSIEDRPSQDIIYSWFMYNGKKYWIIGDYDIDEDYEPVPEGVHMIYFVNAIIKHGPVMYDSMYYIYNLTDKDAEIIYVQYDLSDDSDNSDCSNSDDNSDNTDN